jgi:hypothetical protein
MPFFTTRNTFIADDCEQNTFISTIVTQGYVLAFTKGFLISSAWLEIALWVISLILATQHTYIQSLLNLVRFIPFLLYKSLTELTVVLITYCFCFCFVFLVLCAQLLPVSLDRSSLIAPLLFSSVYFILVFINIYLKFSLPDLFGCIF